MYLNGAGFMMRARATEHSRPLRGRNMGDYLSRSRASQKQARASAAKLRRNAAKCCSIFYRAAQTLCAPPVDGICHYSDMASPKQSISASSDPPAAPSPSERMSRPASVRNVDVMSTEPASKRLVVEAKAISLTFETADGRVDALVQCLLANRRRRVRLLHRPVRLRQDHDAAGDRRFAAADLGHAAGQRHDARRTPGWRAATAMCSRRRRCFRGARSRRT